jgi:hypothetical protein
MTDDGYDLDAAIETAAERTKGVEREPKGDGPDADVDPQAVLSDEGLADRLPPRGAGDNRDEPGDR